MDDRNCISWWFPKLAVAGLPVPRTTVLRCSDREQGDLWAVGDGRPLGRHWTAFVDRVMAAAEEIGWPVFLRTGHTSYKHGWSKSCHLSQAADVPSHIRQLVEFSAIASIIGLPIEVWAVRQLLPTQRVVTIYDGFPLVREFRCFVEDGRLSLRQLETERTGPRIVRSRGRVFRPARVPSRHPGGPEVPSRPQAGRSRDPASRQDPATKPVRDRRR